LEAAAMNELNFLPVDRRSGLSVREFNREYRKPGRPVVITDAMNDWTARSTWTFDYFRSRYGDSIVEVYGYAGGKYQTDRVKSMSLRDYIDGLLTHDWRSYPYYVRDDWKLFRQHSELLADHTIPDYFFDWFKLLPPFLRLVYPRIFIGPQGAVTPLHSDIWSSHAWLAQLVGRKRWILFSPDQRGFLYDNGVQPDTPDFERFPLLKKTRPLDCIIGPGDIIFVPSDWAHQVVSLDPTISLTYNYMGPGCFAPCLTNAVRELLIKRVRGRLLGSAAKAVGRAGA